MRWEPLRGIRKVSSPISNNPTDTRTADELSAKTSDELAEMLKRSMFGDVDTLISLRDMFVFTELMLRGPVQASIGANEFKTKLPVGTDISEYSGEALVRWLYSTNAIQYVEGSEVPAISSLPIHGGIDLTESTQAQAREYGRQIANQVDALIAEGATYAQDNPNLLLLTPAQYEALEDGTVVMDIDGGYFVKGRQYFSEAFGMRMPLDLTEAIGGILAVGIDLTDVASSPATTPVSQEYGGIDFNANNLNLTEHGDKMQIKFSDIDIENLNPESINGILPVIINISPLPSILPLLGLEPRKDEDFELSSLN